MRFRFGSCFEFRSASFDTVGVIDDPGFKSDCVKVGTARLSTTSDEQASNMQYMFLARENFLTNLRNWTVAPETKQIRETTVLKSRNVPFWDYDLSQCIGFIRRVDKGGTTTVKDVES